MKSMLNRLFFRYFSTLFDFFIFGYAVIDFVRICTLWAYCEHRKQPVLFPVFSSDYSGPPHVAARLEYAHRGNGRPQGSPLRALPNRGRPEAAPM